MIHFHDRIRRQRQQHDTLLTRSSSFAQQETRLSFSLASSVGQKIQYNFRDHIVLFSYFYVGDVELSELVTRFASYYPFGQSQQSANDITPGA
jgi:hypothetical protein